jgi:hypothetical protein
MTEHEENSAKTGLYDDNLTIMQAMWRPEMIIMQAEGRWIWQKG